MPSISACRGLSVPVSLALLLVGCNADPTSLDDSGIPALAKGGPAAPPTYAHVAWDDALVVEIDGVQVPAGIRGDGRTADGSPGPSAIQGNLCGVIAVIATRPSEDGTLQFQEVGATGCGAERTHAFYLWGSGVAPWVEATMSRARGLWHMAVGEVGTDQFEGFHLDYNNCGVIYFDQQYAGSSNPKRTRLPDLPNGARQWRVESQSPHRGVCVTTSKGKTVVTFSAILPWAFTVTEVK